LRFRTTCRATRGHFGVGNLITRFFGTNGFGPDPFGAPLVVIGEEAEANPFQFSTKYADGESGLVYYGYRYLAPGIGRWLSRDPIGERRHRESIYDFVQNSPLVHTDSRGLSVNAPPPLPVPWPNFQHGEAVARACPIGVYFVVPIRTPRALQSG